MGGPFDSVKPLEGRRGWSLKQLSTYNRERFEDLTAWLPDTVRGVWEIGLSADGFSRRRFLAVFINDEGRTFLPTARRVWDLLLTEQIPDVDGWFDRSKNATLAQGERVVAELVEMHRNRIQKERDRAQYTYDACLRAIGRSGAQNVREYRRKRLPADHEARMEQLDAADAHGPDLNAVLMLGVGGRKAETS